MYRHKHLVVFPAQPETMANANAFIAERHNVQHASGCIAEIAKPYA